jgi:chorismate dehydratase
VAAVSYLEAQPLLEGLRDNGDVELAAYPPSQMIQRLQWDQADVALLPTIDLQRSDEPLVIIPAGCIAAAGGIMTMRVFSRVRPEKLRLLWADVEARTAVALTRLLWAQNYSRDLEVIPHDRRVPLPDDAEAVLLVGDKVVADPPAGFDWQLDPGALWFEMTGLPFVLAIWAAREESAYQPMYELLRQSRKTGQKRLEEIARRQGPPAGWPEDLAVKYLTRGLQYECTEAHYDGLEEFFDRADECGLLEEYRPLHFYEP